MRLLTRRAGRASASRLIPAAGGLPVGVREQIDVVIHKATVVDGCPSCYFATELTASGSVQTADGALWVCLEHYCARCELSHATLAALGLEHSGDVPSEEAIEQMLSAWKDNYSQFTPLARH